MMPSKSSKEALEMKPAIFLDRDGTLNYDCPYCKNASQIKFYDDIFEPIKELSKDFYMIIITNQAGVAKGFFTEGDLEGMHRKIVDEIAKKGGRIDAIYYCPHNPGQCDCRKPKLGMLKWAMANFDIDLSRSFMVGNSEIDMEFAKNAQIRGIKVRSSESSIDCTCAKDFHEVLEIIKNTL